MHKSMKKLPLWSIARSSCQSNTPAFGGKDVACKVNGWRSFANFNGHDNLSFGRDSITWSWQLEVVNALHLGQKTVASSLLSNLGNKNHSFKANDFVYILEYCARTPDPLFVMETFRTMEEKEIKINTKCHLLIIRALCKGGYLEEAFNMISVLGETPDHNLVLPVYNSFLGACAETHNVNYANKCLDLMDRRLMGKNEITYMQLLKFAVLQKNLSAVHGIWKECNKYYSLSIISLRKFIWSFTSLGDLKSAFGVLQQMVALACRGEFIISKTAEAKMTCSRLDIPIPSKVDLNWCDETTVPSMYGNFENMDSQASTSQLYTKMKEVSRAGVHMLSKGSSAHLMKVLRWSFNDMIHACVQTQDCELAEQLFLQMQNLGVEPSSCTYDGFIRAVARDRGFRDAIQVLKLMQQKNRRPHDSTLATLSVCCSEGLKLDFAEAFLDQISNCSCAYPYNAFLEACDNLDQPERAVQILRKMKQLKLQPDIRTYELLFSLFGNVNAPYEKANMLSQVDAAKRINAIEKDMLSHGIEHSYLSIKNLLKALGTEGMMKELIQHLRVAENQFSRRNSGLGTSIYNTVLHSLVEAKESQMAADIFKTMLLCGYQPDEATYNIMIDCCSIISSFNSARALVSMMIRDGFYPQVPTYTALIKILLAYRDFNQALHLMNQGYSEGIQPDALLFNTILQAACLKGRIGIIEYLVVRMHKEEVQPDASTCGIVFTAYVHSHRFNTAMEALQVMSTRMISEEDIADDEKRSIMEEYFIYAEDLGEAKFLKLFKNYKEELFYALLNLRLCATQGNVISWAPDQSQWAKRLLANYSSRHKRWSEGFLANYGPRHRKWAKRPLANYGSRHNKWAKRPLANDGSRHQKRVR